MICVAVASKSVSADSAKPELGRKTSPQGLAARPPSVTEQTTKIIETNLAEKGRKEPGV
ncbi:MAG TPA: hypothetical protein VKA70_01735 [Blastocatellia bacterium]|nr:hypothetical protein [Blastocatellia bacterium]